MSNSKTPLDPPPAYDEAASPLLPSREKSVPPAGGKVALPRAPFPLDLPALASLRGKRVILASASPRRKQLLAQLGLTFEIVPCTEPEDLSKSLSPYEYVLRTATKKALSVYQAALDDPTKGDPALLIAADTIVVSAQGAILEKPRSEAQHIAMLKELRTTGKHSALTALAVLAPLESARDPGYVMESSVEETVVIFDREVTDDMILAYVKTREGADKAGGYGIQGMGSLLIDRIEGNYETVVGLPTRVTLRLIEKVLADSMDDIEDDDEEEI